MQLAIRPKRNARKLPKRFNQRAVLSAWLVEQAATVEDVRRRAKRRRYLGARLIEAGGGLVIRHRRLSSASGEDSRRTHQDHSSHPGKLRLAVEHFKRRADHTERMSQLKQRLPPLRNRKFADSPPEGDGFELTVRGHGAHRR